VDRADLFHHLHCGGRRIFRCLQFMDLLEVTVNGLLQLFVLCFRLVNAAEGGDRTDLILQRGHALHLLLILLDGSLSLDEFLCFVSVCGRDETKSRRERDPHLATSSSSAICKASTSKRVLISSLSSIRLASD
jgi:hypothetical protein